MVTIIPGINEQELERIKEKLSLVEGKFDWVQIDLLDGTLFPNQTFKEAERFQELETSAKLELHLMVDQPSSWLAKLPKPPFERVVSHIEASEPFDQFISVARKKDFEVGIALDCPTPVEKVEPFLDLVDLVLVMTVKTGFSGQAFVNGSLEKIVQIRRKYPSLPIELDGGMNPETAQKVVRAGATHIVSTSYLFNTGPLEALTAFQASLKTQI